MNHTRIESKHQNFQNGNFVPKDYILISSTQNKVQFNYSPASSEVSPITSTKLVIIEPDISNKNSIFQLRSSGFNFSDPDQKIFPISELLWSNRFSDFIFDRYKWGKYRRGFISHVQKYQYSRAYKSLFIKFKKVFFIEFQSLY